MDYNKIKILIDKYFDGETSISEENELKDFFSSSKNIPSDLLYAKEIFSFFEIEAKQEFTEEFKKTKSVKRNLLLYVSGIAASLFIALFLIFSNIKNEENKIIYAYINGKPITDKKIAEKYTKQILFAVSQNLDKGTKNLNQLNQLNKIEMLIKKEEKWEINF